MGSSAKKKKEKQKDFQKTKLKVGKAKAKPANFTDTSFKTRSIVVNQQSLTEEAPDLAVQFRRHLSLATTSRSDNQRRDALAYMTSQISAKGDAYNNPVGTVGLLNKLLPLISDQASKVRQQLVKLLCALPAAEVRPMAGKILMYVRAGITHLSASVRNDAIGVLEWLLDVAGEELVSCPGGWLKTLNGLAAMMGWVSQVPGKANLGAAGAAGVPAAPAANTLSASKLPLSISTSTSASGWTSAPKNSFAGSATEDQNRGGAGAGSFKTRSSMYARQMMALTKLLEIGLRKDEPAPYNPQAYWDNLYRRPTAATLGANAATASSTVNLYGHLNLFGVERDEDSEMYADREDRQRVFAKRWQVAVERGIEEARREGGDAGRAAAVLDKALHAGMDDYNEPVLAF